MSACSSEFSEGLSSSSSNNSIRNRNTSVGMLHFFLAIRDLWQSIT